MKQKILIVDDSPLLRLMARRAVLQAGIGPAQIREAGNGQEALELLRQEPFDLVLLDINMPVMDGFQFVEQKAKEPAIAGVFVAAVTTEGNRSRLQRLTDLGVSHYLRKPFEPEDLRELVLQLFGEERP